MVNIQDVTKRLDRTMAVLENLAVSNQGQVASILTQLNSATAGMDRTMQSVEAMMKNLETVGADPQTAENLRQTLNNVADASARVVRITQGLENVIADEKTQEDLKATIHNARKLTERADGMLKQVSEIEVKPQADLLYSGGGHDWKTDLNVDVGKKDGPYLRLGVDDIGDGNNVNAQIGKKFAKGNFGFRGGVVNGKAGVGLDIYSGKRFQMSVEGYDPNDMQLRLDAAYDITGHGTALAAQWDHVNDSNKRRAYFGIRQSF
jgi:phospholipid/cholesterol/gamma-HCH transport system substrate-binding protein